MASSAGNSADRDVYQPAHYIQGDIECIDAIEAALTPEEFAGFCKGSSMQYIWRERHKGGIQSCEKAVWYIHRMIDAAQRQVNKALCGPHGRPGVRDVGQ